MITDFAGRYVTVVSRLERESQGQQLFRIKEDRGVYTWSTLMVDDGTAPPALIISEPPRVSPDFLEKVYRDTNVVPIQQAYFDEVGGRQGADGLSAIMLAFGFTKDDRHETFTKMFWTQNYIEGFISGWDSPPPSEEEAEERMEGRTPDYKSGYYDAWKSIEHLRQVGLLQ
jgi:hypothetical protein